MVLKDLEGGFSCMPGSAAAELLRSRHAYGGNMGRRNPVVIVIRKEVKDYGGHRNESWKLAYADFVTALMALFSVLWLLSSSPHSQRAIGAYFNDPSQTGARPGNAQIPAALEDMSKLEKDLREALQKNPDLRELQSHLKMSITRVGLQVELVETDSTPLFDLGGPHPTGLGARLLKGVARELGKLPNQLALEGHTDSTPYAGENGYANWELSIDRANAARRLMNGNGLRPLQVSEVFGSADQNPGNLGTLGDSANRRVTIIVKFQKK